MSARDQADRPVRLRPRFGMVLTIVTAALAVFALAGYIVAGQPLGILLHGWGLVLIVYTVWILFWLPGVTIARDEVVVENPLRRIGIAWAAIVRIDTRWSLRIFTGSGAVTAWAAPAPSRYAMMRVSTVELKGLPESTYGAGQSVGLGDIPQSDSGLAAYYVRRRWELLRDDGLLAGPTTVTRTWYTRRIAVFGVLALATVAGFLLP